MAGAAAAATSGSRARRRAIERKLSAARRAALHQSRRARATRAVTVFDELSDDGFTLLEAQVPSLLARVCEKPLDELESHAVQLVLDTVHREQAKKYGDEIADKTLLQKDVVLSSIEKYAEYVRRSKEIDQMYDMFDKDHDGKLSRHELLRCLQDYEYKHEHRVSEHGFEVRLMVFESDLDFILEQSDAAGDGKISKHELLPALAAWEELAQVRVDKASSSCCIIL